MSDTTNLASTSHRDRDWVHRGRDWADRAWTFVRSNSSVIGAFVVIGGLFVAEGRIGAWLTDAAVVDESDIPAAASTASPLDADGAPSCEPWVLAFSDDFDGDEVDGDRWIRFDSPDRNGNGVRRPSAITVEDGLLVITARQIDGEIVSGAMAARYRQRYGRFEARVRTEADPSEATSGMIITWPADNEHPEGGQNNLYDTLTSANREPFYSYIHRPDSTPREVAHNASGEEWHDLAMEWTPDAITILRDGEIAGTVTDAQAIATTPHVLSIQLVANQATMNDDGGADGTDDTGTDPVDDTGNDADTAVRMYVDWVRIHRANESRPEGC